MPGEAGLRYVGEATYVGHHEEQEPLARSPGRSTSAPSGTMSAPRSPLIARPIDGLRGT